MCQIVTAVARLGPFGQIGPNLALEWTQVQAADHAPQPPAAPALLFYANAPCVVLGRTRKAAVDLTPEALAQPPRFVARRRSGGGTVYHDEQNLNFSLLLPRTWPGLPADPKGAAHFVLAAVVDALGGAAAGAAIERISDVTFRGKKLSGNAQYRGRQVLLHHGTLLLVADKPAISRWLTLPPERPDVSHEDFVADVAHFGFDPSPDHWRTALAAAFGQRLGVDWTWEAFEADALNRAREQGGEFTQPDWVRRF